MADVLLDNIKKGCEGGQAFTGNAEWQLFRGYSSLDEGIIKNEWLYFRIYIVDLATFLAFGDTPKRQLVLDPFVRNVANWLKNRPAPSILEARICLFPDPANPLIFPPENAEPAVKRLNRRIKSYTEATKLENEQANMRAQVFAALCGVSHDIASIVSINGGGKFVWKFLFSFLTRFVMERAGSFPRLTRRRRNHFPTLRLQFFQVFVHAGEHDVDIKAALAGMLLAPRVNLLQNFIRLHGSTRINSAGEQITGHSNPQAAHACSIRRRNIGLLMCLQFQVRR
jgi:hypothetical protein